MAQSSSTGTVEAILTKPNSMKYSLIILLVGMGLGLLGWQWLSADSDVESAASQLSLNPDVDPIPESAKVATLGAGCFWCVEEVFHQTPGVLSAVSGYMGDTEESAEYGVVSSGRTRHAEVVQVHFDSEVISFSALLDRFFELHDPTTLDSQGPDHGPQYRSVIFYHDDIQKLASEAKVRELNEAKKFSRSIVTEVTKAPDFYVAEDYHQNFARLNPGHGYLRNFLYPKLKKLGMIVPTGSGFSLLPKGSSIKGSSSKP